MNIQHEIIESNYTIRRMSSSLIECSHWHQRVEIAYIKAGSCTVGIANESYDVKAGDIVFVHSGEIHRYSKCSDDISVIIFTFNPYVIQQMKSEMVYIKSHITSDMLEKSGALNVIDDLFDEIYEENVNGLVLSENIIISDFVKLYSFLARYFPNNTKRKNINLHKFRMFQETLEYISTNYMEKITLEDIAKRVNYGTAYISKMFVLFTGVNFKTYIDTIRITNSVDLLRKTDKTVANIATECGFDNLKTFNNTFKRIAGMTPSELRGLNI